MRVGRMCAAVMVALAAAGCAQQTQPEKAPPEVRRDEAPIAASLPFWLDPADRVMAFQLINPS